ncbi:MAG: hypothetical protein HFG79_00340 [Lachnospiraceae bacterium]|nr:hypothetical protein [Lachnospiraceae bacterium]
MLPRIGGAGRSYAELKQRNSGQRPEGFYTAGRGKMLPRIGGAGRSYAELKQRNSGQRPEGFYTAGRGKMLPRIGSAGRSYAELIIGEINYGIDFESERFV